jgi:putative transcriptional regulator
MKYKSEIYEVMHQDAMADFEVGAISEERMKEYDEMCLVKEPEPAYEAEKPMVMEHVTA